VRFDDGKIEHVDYPAMEEGGIAVWRKDLRDVLVGTFFKDEAIEHTVDKIAQRAGEDESGTDDESAVILLLYDGLNIVDAEHDGYETEEGQRHLSPGAAKFPAPGHAFILYEVDLGFVAQQLDAIIVGRDGSCKIVGGMT